MNHLLVAALYCGIAVCPTWAQDTARSVPLPLGVRSSDPGFRLVFAYEGRESLPSWEIALGPDRTGSYRELSADAVSQPMHVSEAVWKRLQAGTRAVRSGHCETRQKGVAQTGKKTFSFADGPESGAGSKSCSFNYSDDQSLNEAGSAFIALADTMQQGARLQHDLRFARLSLDADIDSLVDGVAAGRSLEPGNIASLLQSIAEDDHVIDRVRRKAARLLQASASTADKPL